MSTSEKSGSVRSSSFIGLALTQFLGAFNDNMFRWLAVPIGQRTMDPTQALVLGGVLFTLPYLLLAPLSGSLADRLRKRTVIVWCKVAEIVLVGLGVVAIATSQLWLLFALVFLLGAQSALFGPAKFGSLPEILAPESLSKGNGILGLATVTASALGLVAGYKIYGVIEPALNAGPTLSSLWLPAAVLIGTAVLGTLTSLLVQTPAAANPQARIAWNPVMETVPALRVLFRDVRLLRCALGIGFFWMLASLAQLNIDPFGKEGLHLAKEDVGVLMAVLVAGLGVGSVLAGIWSQGKVELGLVPLGAFGISLSALGVFVASRFVTPGSDVTSQPGFYAVCAMLFSLGGFAAMFDIPLEAYLQHRSDDSNRGTVLAGSNFVSFSLILVSCGAFELFHGVLKLSPAAIFMLAGLGTIPIVVYVVLLLPEFLGRFIFYVLSRVFYRLRVHGRENIPERGGALLVANHVSWIDGILLLISSSRFVRFIMYADYVNKPFLRWICGKAGVIPIKSGSGPRAIVTALNEAREAILRGEVVCIFAEGSLTRTGQLQPFQRGLMRIVAGTSAPIIPVYLHGLWGSIFSFRGGRFFWKKPALRRYPVAIHFGTPLAQADDVNQVRQAVELLGVEANEMARSTELTVARRFLRQARRSRFRLKIADSAGKELTGGKTLAGALVLRSVLRREVLTADEKNVGILLPPSAGGCLANIAMALDGRTTVNLNYTMADPVINYCVKKAGLKHVLTSRKVLEKKPVALEGAEWVYLEDVFTKVTSVDKAKATLNAYVTPLPILERVLGLTNVQPDDLLTIVFTSGSTGDPKGVMLTQSNIASNVQAVDQLLQLKPNDCLLGILPFFHSFGYTATLWLPMCFDASAVYHFNPLDAKTVGTLAEKYKVSIMLAAPTFLRNYAKRCTKEQFSALHLVVTGAEKLPMDLAEEFKEKFGFYPSEGYGTTEMSPVAAVNIPDHLSRGTEYKTNKLGTVGRAIPGCAVKVVNPDTWQDLGINTEGLLLVKGPNIMKGYLGDPQKSAEVIRDGWYASGDFAKIDEEGFVHITGRQSRFSKIGGEMVPHIRIEEELNRLSPAASPEDVEPRLAISAAPDASRGERLIVLYTQLAKPAGQLVKELSATGVPNLWLPSTEAFYQVEKIPQLGTGKLDLAALKKMALELAAGGKPAAKEARPETATSV
ncbi:MAG TPA: acyl-[ACP]--phospholipid O-acyltransferase [Caulifigura sp.]|nr:acyl-[ACP]--phospholipid O-acyltransferase [Caulifigura sp.]